MQNGVPIIGNMGTDKVNLDDFPKGWVIVADGANEYIGKLQTQRDANGKMPNEWLLEPCYLFVFRLGMSPDGQIHFERKSFPLLGFPGMRRKVLLDPKSVTDVERDIRGVGVKVLRETIALAENMHTQLSLQAMDLVMPQPGQVPDALRGRR